MHISRNQEILQIKTILYLKKIDNELSKMLADERKRLKTIKIQGKKHWKKINQNTTKTGPLEFGRNKKTKNGVIALL